MRFTFTIITLFFVASLSGQTLNIHNSSETLDNVKNKTVNISGNSELHLDGEDPINGATFNVSGDEAWVYLHGEKPSYLKERLSQFTVNGSIAVVDANVRVHQYEMGTVLISHDNDFAGATLFDNINLEGDSLNIKHHLIYSDSEGLGPMNNATSSILLRKGYMMTIAQEDNGMGYSRNYVADKSDIILNELPEALNDEISFVRVIRWNWATKKGINATAVGDSVQASWYYNWGSSSQSLDNIEFVPMKWAGGDINQNNFIDKKHITHQLAFNEPSHTEQANMSVEKALREYPKLLATGLRAGSPNIADNGRDWLYEFMDKADELNYRVDFVGVHWYKGCQSATQFYNWIKTVHDRTGRPIWVTEWNNGADWTSDDCIPSFEEQAEKIASFLHMFDTCSFVERYCIYNWGVETRKLANLKEDKTVNYLYPSGIVYRDQPSPFAYNSSADYTPTYVEIPPPTSLTATKQEDDGLTLTWYENAYQEDGFSIERSLNEGSYEEIASVNGEQRYQVSYTDYSREEFGEYRYRVRTMKGSKYSIYSNVVLSILDDGVYDTVYIQHIESGKKLKANGWNVEMCDASETGTDVQWMIIPADEGYSFIENIGSHFRLHNGDEAPNLVENKWTGANVQWILGEAGDDNFFLTNRNRGERIFTKSDNLDVLFVGTNYTGTKVQWKFVKAEVPIEETNVSSTSEKNYSIYPNPTSNKLYIQGLEKLTKFSVLDLSGRKLWCELSDSEINVENLESGMYFLQMEDGQILPFIKK